MRNILRGLIITVFSLFLVTTALAATQNNNKTIAQIAASQSKFTTLVSALKAAGLVGVLNGRTDYTVFAPTNRAFSKLPKGTLQNLMQPKNRAKLRKILLYHVVRGDYTNAKLAQVQSVKTVEGQRIHVAKKRRSIVLNNNTRVRKKDIMASNGIIHVVNNVLLPPKS